MPGRAFLGDPVAKTSPSSAGVTGSIPGQGAKIPHVSHPKTQTETTVHIKKKKKKL